MKLGLALVAILSWAGCAMDPMSSPTGGGAGPGPGGGTGPGSNPGDPGDGTGPVTTAPATIAASTTWSGTVHVPGTVTINAGAMLTVAAGTTVDVDPDAGFVVNGTLAINGSKDAKAVFRASTTGGFWGEISIAKGGAMTATYLVQTGGQILINTGATATITDSVMSHAQGDLLTMLNGTLHMTYSQIGLDTGHDSTHCDTHMEGKPTFDLTHSNLSAAAYGMMFYGGTSSNLTYNNYFGNGIDMDTVSSDPVSGDVSHSFFANGTPDLPGTVTATNMATARVTDAGPR